jgi:hypothetical protein
MTELKSTIDWLDGEGTHAPPLFSLSVHITHKHWAASHYGRRGRTLRENTVQRDLLAEAAERRQKWS